MMLNNPFKRIVLVVFGALLTVGCGGEAVQTPSGVNVDVTITRGGKPLGNVEVTFVPVDGDASKAIFAPGDGQGKALIMNAEGREYKVCVSRMAAGGPDPEFAKYGEDSPLRANVLEGAVFTFDLE